MSLVVGDLWIGLRSMKSSQERTENPTEASTGSARLAQFVA